jgi:hypothetical protein
MKTHKLHTKKPVVPTATAAAQKRKHEDSSEDSSDDDDDDNDEEKADAKQKSVSGLISSPPPFSKDCGARLEHPEALSYDKCGL